MGNKYILILIFSLFIFNFVSADKIVNPESQGHLDINTWGINAVKVNTGYTFVWDVADDKGLLLNNTATNCSFFLIEAGTSNQIVAGIANRTPDNFGWYKEVPGNSFNTIGQYNYQIDCFLLSNTSLSGNLLDSFFVTPSGSVLDVPESFIILGLLFLIVLISAIFFFSAVNSDREVTKLTFYTTSAIFLFMAILYGVLVTQQTLWGFTNIISGVETFWFVIKSLMTIGILAFFVIIFLMMLKYWKIKRGMID